MRQRSRSGLRSVVRIVTTPWAQFAPIDPARGYLATASFLPLKRRRKVFRFMRYSGEVRRQLEGSQGLVGFSVRAKLLSGRFWTLSAWKDAPALMAFVRKVPHSRIMASFQPYMAATKFVQWRVEGSADPPTWDAGLRRLEDGTHPK